MSAPLSPAERAVVDRFETAEPAPESLREQVAKAIHDADEWECSHGWPCGNANLWRRLAAAAVTAMRGQQ